MPNPYVWIDPFAEIERAWAAVRDVEDEQERALGLQARAFAQETYSLRRQCEEMVRLYASAVGAPLPATIIRDPHAIEEMARKLSGMGKAPNAS